MNKCFQCDCYDEDYGCTMPSIDKGYACPLNQEYYKEQEETNDENRF